MLHIHTYTCIHMFKLLYVCSNSSSASRDHELIPNKNNTDNMILFYINVLFVVII